MCGIYGELSLAGRPAVAAETLARCRLLAHRGPDDEGVWTDGPLALAHRRLAILDLSPQARQPLANEDGTLRLVANGEIYNHRELRTELETRGHRFRSASDSEVILHAYEEHGVDCVARLRGMFAFALWDGARRRLLLARDRLGEKPLHYHAGPRLFAFASGLAPLLAHPDIARDLDPTALRLALTLQSVPAPWTAFRAIRKLEPGHLLLVEDGRVETRRYWQLAFAPKRPATSRAAVAARVDEVRGRFDDAVRRCLESDVPVGVFLSGGIDSSAVLAAALRHSVDRPLRAFVARFDVPGFDETPWARKVARQLGAELVEVVVGPEVVETLPDLVERFGEPFADPAALPLHALARAARSPAPGAERCGVALGGDGGDELFAGYPRHAAVLLASASRERDRTAGPAGTPLGRSLRLFAHFPPESLPELLTPELLAAADGPSADELLAGRAAAASGGERLDELLAADLAAYLPDTLLVKSDVATMAAGLELRSPLLDVGLVELAARLPDELRIRRGTAKWIWKRAVARDLPRSVVRREKRGFSVPLAAWMRGPWRTLLRDVLLSERARGRGLFRPGAVERLLAEHDLGERAGRRLPARHYQLYNLLTLELWHRRVVDRA